MHTCLRVRLGLSLIGVLASALQLTAQSSQSVVRSDGLPGTNAGVWALGVRSPGGSQPAQLVCGGAFTLAGSVAANRVVATGRDTGAWSALGVGLNGQANALATLPNGDLMVGGSFTNAGGAAANRIARWDGSAWSPLGTGLNNTVFALCVMPNGDLIAGGSFTTAGGAAANRIARWNGSAWSPLGSGASSAVQALHVRGSRLYVGGAFTTAGGLPANRIASWDGTAWSPLGTGVGSTVRAIFADSTDVIVGGDFTTLGDGTTAPHLAAWNLSTSTWSRVGAAGTRSVFTSTVSPGGDLVIGGAFLSAGGMTLNRIGRRRGSMWEPFGAGILGSVTSPQAAVYASAFLPNGDLVAGGAFDLAGVGALHCLYRWDGTSWTPLGSGFTAAFGDSPVVRSLVVLPNGDLVAGGRFVTVDGVPASNIARWDGVAWSPLGSGTNGTVLCLAVLPNGDLIAGGGFTTAGGVAHNGIARWSGGAWSGLGTGVNGSVYALAASPNGDLVAGGSFFQAGGVAASQIARWNGSAWSPLGSGVGGTVLAVATLPSGDVIAGGQFLTAGGNTAKGVARWDGASWSPMGTGLGTLPIAWATTLTALPNGVVIAAGEFFTADDKVAEAIAAWDGTSWSALDSVVGETIAGDSIRCFAPQAGGGMVAGGTFLRTGSGYAGRIARWTGASWSAMGTGASGGGVYAAKSLANGDVVAGGSFSLLGGQLVSNIGRWDGATWASFPNGGTSNTVYALEELGNGDLIAAGAFTSVGTSGGPLPVGYVAS